MNQAKLEVVKQEMAIMYNTIGKNSLEEMD